MIQLLKTILSWVFAVIAFIFGISLAFVGGHLGLLLAAAGLFAIPRVRQFIEPYISISFSRRSVIAIIIVFSLVGLLGGAITANVSDGPPETSAGSEQGPAGSEQDTPDEAPEPQQEIIEANASMLLPTIEDFDSDWLEPGTDHYNSTNFYNTQTETTVVYEVTVYNSVADARSQLEDRKQSVTDDGYGTESVNVGNSGFMYKPGQDYIVIHFRQNNVIGKVEYLPGPGVLTPESNAVNLARKLNSAIVE